MNHEQVIQANKTLQARAPLMRGVLQRKCACGQHTPGGGECIECRSRKDIDGLQPKLKIAQLNDKYEQEANRIADKVMRMPYPNEQVLPVKSSIQRKHVLGPSQVSAVSSIPVRKPIDTLAHAEAQVAAVSGGRPLSAKDRAYFESRFGADFSPVRIHDDATADRATRAVGALAYTRGRDIVFKQGQYTPDTTAGRHLLAHELTHVVQQGVVDSSSPVTSSINPLQRLQNHETLQCVIDEDGQEAGPYQASNPVTHNAADMSEEETVRLGRQALASLGYEEIIRQALAAGILIAQGSTEESNIQHTLDPDFVQRQGFGAVFSRYAVAAGIASQVDSPAPGPGDVVAVGILVVGLIAAIAATTSTTARPCPPCPAPPSPQIDRVPPSRPHFPCPGDHWHYYVYNQNPVTCQCFGPRRMFGGCCGMGASGAPC